MNNYLDKFRSGLRAVQSQQILQLLTKEKDNGNIASVEEFKVRLEELTSKLQSERLTPTVQLFLGRFQSLVDSESFNFMIDRIQDDLTAAYSEMNTIDEVLNAHETIINNVVIENLEVAINELDSRISSLEFINKNKEGFNNAIFNTFRITQNNKTGGKSGLFKDPKTGLTNLGSVEAKIDPIGEKLILAPEIESEYKASSVRQIFDFEAIASELDVEFEDSSLLNIIDSRPGTFWAQSILLSNSRNETGVLTKLEIDLGSVQSINFIEIEPFVLFPIELVGITIIDANNQPITILTEAVQINSANKFFFNAAAAKKVLLKFKNKSYSLVQFTTKPGSPIPELTRDLSNLDTSIQNISNDLNDLISSPLLKDSMELNDFIEEEKSFYEYLIGFDNIRLGLGNFDDTSIFVSRPETVKDIGSAAIQVSEKRPIGAIASTSIEYTADTYPQNYTDYFHASLEYYLIKKDYSSADVLLSSITVPVLPLGVENIRHERLLLTNKSSPSNTLNDIGFLQFYTLNNPYHSIDNPTGTIRVYRNGYLLENADLATGPNASTETDGWHLEEDLTQDTPGSEKAMRYYLRIQNPNDSNIYTVSYTPAISTINTVPNAINLGAYSIEEGIQLVDLSGDLGAWLGTDNIVYFKKTAEEIPIDYSTISLAVVLRRNSANVNLTPVLFDYLIATGNIDKNKFGD